jgi:dienelactone hydrolase
MSTTIGDEHTHASLWAGLRAIRLPFAREAAVATGSIAVVALHVADDNFLQPNPGTSAVDHLFGGAFLLGLLAAAAVLYGRVRPGARAAIALLAGFLGVLVGTEAVYYTREVGPSGDDYTGLLSIPAGFVLVGLGTFKLWTSRRLGDRLWRRYGRRALRTAGAAVVVALVLFPLAGAYIITHAARAHVPTADLGASYENVEFTTSDGLLLKGWYIPSQNGAAVISFPGRADTQKRAKMLARHGYGVLVFDRRGEGESEGDPNMLGWHGERDVHAAVTFLQSRPDVEPDRIGGIGLSVGGEMMIEAAAESSDLKAIVSEGASTRSIRDEFANPETKLPKAYFFGMITAATTVFTDNVPPADLMSLVPRIKGSVFFVYGEHGQPEEKPANTAFYEAAQGEKALWEVPGSTHMNGIDAQPQEYERRVVSFFNRTLLR